MLPTVDRGAGPPDDGVAAGGRVLEPEVLESLDAAEHARTPGPLQPVGCTVGPGCGCLGLPIAVIAGVVISSVIALLWVLSLGRLPVSLLRLAQQARRGFSRS